MVIAVFMLLFGCNFNLFYLVLIGQASTALQSEELRVYLGIIAGAVLLIALNIMKGCGGFLSGLRYAFFQVMTVLSTTGFSTCDFDRWPELSRWVLVLLMFIGACAGSTGGGMKVSRFLIAGKYMKAEISRFRHPRQVKTIWLNGAKIGDDLLRSVLVYLVAYILLFVVSLMLITIEGYDMLTNFTAVATTYNNVGPGLNLVGPVCNFSFFSPLSKLVFSFDMLAGRLEVLPLVVLLSAAAERVERIFHRINPTG
jgi:trk system potassium uptake protein TrkH